MNSPDRRRIPRIAPEAIAYLDIKPDNGGIVVNVSENGLCFQSAFPVELNQSLAFSLIVQESIDAEADIIWTDDTHKFGGLRFRNPNAGTQRIISKLLAAGAPQHDDNSAKVCVDLAHNQEEPLFKAGEDSQPRDEHSAPSPEVKPLVDEHEAGTPPFPETSLTSLQTSPVPVSLESWRVLDAPVLENSFEEDFPAQGFAIGSATAAETLGKFLSHRKATILIVVLLVFGSVEFLLLSRLWTRSSQQQSTTSVQVLSVPKIPVQTSAAIPRPLPSEPSRRPRRTKQTRTIFPTTRVVSPSATTPAAVHLVPLRYELPSPARSGTVQLDVLVSATGAPEEITFVSGSRNLAGTSIAAVKAWRYPITQSAGRPVKARTHVTFRYIGSDAVSVRFGR
jgi:Gram-negative bacterial TonB protein C-terminal/PilZ domain